MHGFRLQFTADSLAQLKCYKQSYLILSIAPSSKIKLEVVIKNFSW